jgi:outer membrane protein insertion porin family
MPFALVLFLAFQKQTVAPENIPFPLESLRVEGNKRISTERIVAASGLKIGKPVAKADFDAARERLMATGAFMSVGVEFKPSDSKNGYAGGIQVLEIEQVFPYRFEDLPAPEAELRAALRKQEPVLGEEIPGTKDVMDRYAKELEQAIEKLGGGHVQVTGKLLQDVVGKPTVIFRPPGSRPNIARVLVEGNDALPNAMLVNALSNVAVGAPYSDTIMRQFLDAAIRPLYEARGRIRVSFPKIAVKQDNDVNGVVVTVTVNEGPSYNLGAVKIAGIAAASELKKLEREGNWRTDDIANFDDVKAGVDRIVAYLHTQGRLHAAANVDRTVDDKAHKVDLVVTVTPGPQFLYGKLEIVGLDIISEPVIRKMWGAREGKPFDPAFPDEFLKSVREEGIFDNLGKTTAESKPDEKTLEVAVTLKFGAAAAEDPRRRKKIPE